MKPTITNSNNIFGLSLICFLFFFFSSCGRSSKDKYVGYLFEDKKDREEPLQIVKEGETLYVKAVKWESPTTYNTEDHSLKFEISNGLVSLRGTLNLLEDKDRMKMYLAKNSVKFIRASESEAKKRIAENEAYYDPSFL